MRSMHNNQRRGGGNRYNNPRSGYNRGASSGGTGYTSGRPLNRNHSFDSVNPGGGRLRGTAQQLSEKYAELARAASSGSDSTLAENLLQHAEHYSRLNNEILEAMGFTQQQRDPGTGENEGAPELTAYPPAPPAPQMPAEQPSLGDFDPPEFLRVRKE